MEIRARHRSICNIQTWRVVSDLQLIYCSLGSWEQKHGAHVTDTLINETLGGQTYLLGELTRVDNIFENAIKIHQNRKRYKDDPR